MSGAPPTGDDGYIQPPPEAQDAERPDIEEVFERVTSLADGDGNELFHAIAYFGEDDLYWYYIAVLDREYEGNEYLNERYVQLVKPGIPDRGDSWKKNGINRRVTGHLQNSAAVLANVYARVARFEAAFQRREASLDEHEMVYHDAVTGDVEVDDA